VSRRHIIPLLFLDVLKLANIIRLVDANRVVKRDSMPSKTTEEAMARCGLSRL
jgi:hypothetical protein